MTRFKQFTERTFSVLVLGAGGVLVVVADSLRTSAQLTWDRMTFALIVVWLWIVGTTFIGCAICRVFVDARNGWREVRSAWRRAND